MDLYAFPTYNVTKVLFTAEELEQPYTLHWLDPAKGEHKTPEHLQRHPLGRVPVVALDGRYFFESNTICRLLAERNGGRLYAGTPESRAEIDQWMDLMAHHIGRWLAIHYYEEVIKPRVLHTQTDEDALAGAGEMLRQELPALEQRLAGTEWLAGERMTLADIIAFAYCHTHEFTSVSLDELPATTQWYQRMKSRPSFERVMARLPGGVIWPT